MSNTRLTVIATALIAGALLLHFFGQPKREPEPKPVDYLQIVRAVKDHPAKVRSLTIERGTKVILKFKDPKRKELSTPYPSEEVLEDLVRHAEKNRVPVYAKNLRGDSTWKLILINLIGPIVFFVLLFLLFGRMSGVHRLLQGRNFKQEGATDAQISFKDVAGIGEAIEEVKEVVDFLDKPEKFERLGARVPRGVLFVGPPGTGKTLLARAVAGESGASFFSLTGSDFVEMLAGLGANRVRDLFRKAREAAPAIVFIDEIDAVGRSRSSINLGGHEEREQTLNQLLAEMDGFRPGEAVVVIAATNRPDILDPALLRPGRFDRQIVIDAPDVRGREEILRVHARGKPIADRDRALRRLAQRTPGFTGAELANLLNEAALLAARRDLEEIDDDCLSGALDRVLAGLERKSRVMNEQERVICAYHEVGHALCAHYAKQPLPVQKISIISRGRALGFTLSIPEQDRLLETKDSLMDQLVMLLGGRAAEQVVFGQASSGAANDLERATALAMQMVVRFGMSEEIGPRMIPGSEEGFLGQASFAHLQCAPETARIIDQEVSKLTRQAEDRARQVIQEHRAELELVASALQEEETIEQERFLQLLEQARGDGKHEARAQQPEAEN